MAKRKIMRSFKLNEISAVDRPAQAGARMIIMKRRGEPGYDPKNSDPGKRGRADDLVEKVFTPSIVVLTSADNGHAHAVWVHLGDRGGNTSYGQDPEDEHGHSHPWKFTEEGGIAIAMDSGHVHTVSNDEVAQAFMAVGAERLRLVIAERLAEMFGKSQFTADEREELAAEGKALTDGSFPIVTRKDLQNAIAAFSRSPNNVEVARHIKRRAEVLGATSLLPVEGKLASLKQKAGQTADDIGNDRDEDSMTTKDDQKKAADKDPVKAAEKRAEVAEASLAKAVSLAELNDAQKSFYGGLDETDQAAFLKLDADGRNAAIKRAEDKDKVIYKSEDGTEYRASDDGRLVKLAKQADEDRKARKEAEQRATNSDLAKRAADDFAFIPGDIDTRIEMLKAIDGIADETHRTKALDALKAQNVALSKAFETYGSSAVPQGDVTEKADAEGRLDALAKKHQEANSGLTFAQAYDVVVQQPEGAALYTKSLGVTH